MKNITFLIIASILFVTTTYSQTKIDEIAAKDGIHFITTAINYPITGTYLFEGEKEPIVQLNSNGTGIFQLNDLSTTPMTWGIECDDSGAPKVQKGFNYAVYSLWYKNTNTLFGTTDNWNKVHFSIHFEKKKMFILGDRSKDYLD